MCLIGFRSDAEGRTEAVGRPGRGVHKNLSYRLILAIIVIWIGLFDKAFLNV